MSGTSCPAMSSKLGQRISAFAVRRRTMGATRPAAPGCCTAKKSACTSPMTSPPSTSATDTTRPTVVWRAESPTEPRGKSSAGGNSLPSASTNCGTSDELTRPLLVNALTSARPVRSRLTRDTVCTSDSDCAASCWRSSSIASSARSSRALSESCSARALSGACAWAACVSSASESSVMSALDAPRRDVIVFAQRGLSSIGGVTV